MSYDREPVEATIAQLEPRMKNVTIKFKVMDVGDAREVSSRKDGSTHRVADAIVGDESGIVRVPLWDATIDELEVGKTFTLKNGYTGLFKGNLQLNIGRYGELEEAEEAIDEVNEEVDMSAEEHDDPRRRNYGGGSRGGGGGYGGRSGGRDRRGGGSYGRRDRSY